MTQTFPSSRTRILLLAVIAGMFAALAWLPIDAADVSLRYRAIWPLMNQVGGPVCTVIAALLFLQGLFPVTLRLDAEGFSVVGGLTGGYRVAWRDVETFQLTQISQRSSAKAVIWSFRPGVRPKSLILRLLQDFSVKPALPVYLKIEPEALLGVMNQALEASRR